MLEREKKIAEAAFDIFMRFGVKRSSMNDIAKEAGIARQTLYNAFANKDEVLRATIRMISEKMFRDIEEALPTTRNLSEQLDLVFDQLTIQPYVMIHASPNATDLMDGFNKAGEAELHVMKMEFQALIARLLQPYEAQLNQAGTNAEELAEVVRIAAKAMKNEASSREHLEAMLRNLKQIILNSTGQA